MSWDKGDMLVDRCHKDFFLVDRLLFTHFRPPTTSMSARFHSRLLMCGDLKPSIFRPRCTYLRFVCMVSVGCGFNRTLCYSLYIRDILPLIII